jgi:hypothetical protein
MSSIAVRPREHLRADIAYSLAALLVVAAGIATLWYRAHYNIWPGQAATARVHWCGRNYQKDGPPESWHQVTAGASYPVRSVGKYPPLGLTRQELFAPAVPHAQLASCATVVDLSTGPGQYQPYTLLGGP